MRVGVLASGEGTNLQALIDGAGFEVAAVASDKTAAPALARARAAEIATQTFPRERFLDRPARDAAVTDWLEEHGIELVVLAGYMALLDAEFVRRWAGRLVNVHPSLLPAFPGVRAIEQALAYGGGLFGVTVHLVDEGVDTGPILLQEAVALPHARTPEEVHDALRPVEHRLLLTVVRAFAVGGVQPDPAHPRRWIVSA